MDIVWYLLGLALIGLVMGALGRLIVPGPDPMGIGATILVGIAGAFVAGLVARAIWGDEAAPGFILTVIVTALLVWALRRFTRRHAGTRR